VPARGAARRLAVPVGPPINVSAAARPSHPLAPCRSSLSSAARERPPYNRCNLNVDWDLMLPDLTLEAQSSMVSDHSPLILTGNAATSMFRGFRFESFWLKLPRYSETVQAVWNQPIHVYNPFLRLHIKLARTAKALKQWARKNIGNNKLLLTAARQLIGILDVVQEHRQLSIS